MAKDASIMYVSIQSDTQNVLFSGARYKRNTVLNTHMLKHAEHGNAVWHWCALLV